MDIKNRNNVPPFITKDKSEIREIMAPANSSIEKISLAEATVYPGQSTVRHIHTTFEEIYYILKGKGIMQVGDEESEVGPGDAIGHLAGVPHKITNIGDEPLVFFCICTPHYTHEDTVLLDK